MPISFRGKDVCVCVPPVVLAAEALFGEQVPITQGGYNAGGVSASAGTHDGGGVWDNRIRDYPLAKQLRWIECVRTVGGWGWIRTSPPFPTRHAHMLVIGCPHLSYEAKKQERDAYNGYDGLAGHDTLDPHRSLGIKPTTYADYVEGNAMATLDADDKAWLTAMIDSKFSWAKDAYWQPTLAGVATVNKNVWTAIGEIRAVSAKVSGDPIDYVKIGEQIKAQVGDELADNVVDEIRDRLGA